MSVTKQSVTIRISDKVGLEGNLNIPDGAECLILFAHGSGSSRLSPRNRYVASILRQAGLATLLFDLLTPQEEAIDLITAELRFNIKLLTDRLVGATDWTLEEPAIKDLKIGYFGASTGVAAALAAAAKLKARIFCIVSRGGRPDLADYALSKVEAPTLLIVGQLDYEVIELNRKALAKIGAEKQLTIVGGATHLFEETGTLEKVAELAKDWFLNHL